MPSVATACIPGRSDRWGRLSKKLTMKTFAAPDPFIPALFDLEAWPRPVFIPLMTPRYRSAPARARPEPRRDTSSYVPCLRSLRRERHNPHPHPSKPRAMIFFRKDSSG